MKNSSQPCTKQLSGFGDSNDIFTAQCGECFKWRVIDTQEEYEELRATFIEEPFICSKKLYTCCDDPADIQYDNSRTWVIDKPNLPKSPPGFKRKITLRKDISKSKKMDVTYRAPNGKPMRSPNDVAKFLEDNPEYAEGVSVSDMSFILPKLMMDTLPSVKPSRND